MCMCMQCMFTLYPAVLHFQLKEVPEDFFVDIVSRSNFLTVTLQVYNHTRTDTGSAPFQSLFQAIMHVLLLSRV